MSSRGPNRRKSLKADLAHMPSGHGKGRWHNRATLWRAYLKARRKRRIAKLSRRVNR